MPKITPSLWFDTEGLGAAEHYVSIFPNSRITNVMHYGEGGPRDAGSVMTVDFELDGQPFSAINGGPQFSHSEAVSFVIPCDGQAEVDHYWERLTDGGAEGQCGWCKDRFGVSWQVIPNQLGELLGDVNPTRAQAAMQAMMGMSKIDLAEMRSAADDAEAADVEH